MNNSRITRLSVIAVIAASLLAVGVVAAISMAGEADAFIRNRLTQSNSASVTQSATSSGGTASNSASVTQSNRACPNPPGCD